MLGNLRKITYILIFVFLLQNPLMLTGIFGLTPHKMDFVMDHGLLHLVLNHEDQTKCECNNDYFIDQLHNHCDPHMLHLIEADENSAKRLVVVKAIFKTLIDNTLQIDNLFTSSFKIDTSQSFLQQSILSTKTKLII